MFLSFLLQASNTAMLAPHLFSKPAAPPISNPLGLACPSSGEQLFCTAFPIRERCSFIGSIEGAERVVEARVQRLDQYVDKSGAAMAGGSLHTHAAGTVDSATRSRRAVRSRTISGSVPTDVLACHSGAPTTRPSLPH